MRVLKAASLIAPLAMATSALAQDAACVGAEGAVWAMTDAGGSDLSGLSERLDVMSLAPVGQAIETAFTVSQGGMYRLEAQGTMGGDTLIELFDASGEFLGSDDDTGGNLGSLMEVDLAPGHYCLKTTSYDEAVLAATVGLGRIEHAPLGTPATDGDAGFDGVNDPGACPRATTVQMLLVGDAEGKFATTEYAVTPESDPYLLLRVEGTIKAAFEAVNQTADPVLTVYDADGMFIRENDDYDGLDSMVDFADGLEPGTYCVKVDALSDVTLPITFRASYLDVAERDLREIEAGLMAPPLDGSYPVIGLGDVTGTMATAVQLQQHVASWVSFSTDRPLMVALSGSSTDLDPELELFDESGASIGYNDDGPTGLDSLLVTELPAGTYRLAVRSIDVGVGTVNVELRPYVPMGK